jgi:hypothetical protein
MVWTAWLLSLPPAESVRWRRVYANHLCVIPSEILLSTPSLAQAEGTQSTVFQRCGYIGSVINLNGGICLPTQQLRGLLCNTKVSCQTHILLAAPSVHKDLVHQGPINQSKLSIGNTSPSPTYASGVSSPIIMSKQQDLSPHTLTVKKVTGARYSLEILVR